MHEGVPMSQPLQEDPIFPADGQPDGEAMARRRVSFRQCSGRSPISTKNKVDASIQSLTSIIEPILMIGVGVMVGTIVISMYLPMFKLLTLISERLR